MNNIKYSNKITYLLKILEILHSYSALDNLIKEKHNSNNSWKEKNYIKKLKRLIKQFSRYCRLMAEITKKSFLMENLMLQRKFSKI